jgi:hypothetical protein
MEKVRLVEGERAAAVEPCSRCQAAGCPWDRIADKPMCPDCQEAIALGEGPPVQERAAAAPCSICRQRGTLRYQTYPLQANGAVEFDLCREHFQALLSRRLDPHAFQQLDRQLRDLGLSVRQVFLLHDAFYDEQGQPLQPVPETF